MRFPAFIAFLILCNSQLHACPREACIKYLTEGLPASGEILVKDVPLPLVSEFQLDSIERHIVSEMPKYNLRLNFHCEHCPSDYMRQALLYDQSQGKVYLVRWGGLLGQILLYGPMSVKDVCMLFESDGVRSCLLPSP